ncbi:Hypothetical predicted protein [Olea europaea subsp. europaea]|uniref:Uncharacterized protein n=1 Tax=Olea europaea subsp. europaea TaxID=158383 RepID=A0A8S0RGJ1_OLEEU|nr:Hypothetical predicted protein [Olea europaea subsp. europaea]
MEIRDLDPSDMEMAMPYMYEVQYIKPVQPELACGEKRKGGMVDRSIHSVRATRKPSYSSEKTSMPLLMLTDGRLGHSDVPLDDGNDDFVDFPPRWQGTMFDANSPGREDQPVPNDFFKQLTELQTENHRMSIAIDAIKSEISSLKHDQQNKLNNIVHMEGEIHIDLIDIRSNLQFMTEFVTALISSSMEEILTKFKDKSRLNIVRDYETLDKVGDAEITIDSKGKGKMETEVDVELPYSLQPPSFDLGVCFTQPIPIELTKSKKMETYVASVSHVTAPSSGLPVKRAPRSAKALQSPYVHEGKQNKHSNNVVIFQHYNQSVGHADIADLQSWFQRGYKPHNKKKFNDRDDRIRPPFLVGQFLVENKTWWYELVSRDVSLSSSVCIIL